MKRLACPAAVLTGLLLIGRVGAEEYHIGQDDPCHTHEQAGYPLEVSKRARPSNTPSYGGYYVGGGCGKFTVGCCSSWFCRGGRPPSPEEGTWGWDYFGHPCFPKHIVLGWGAPYQGGYGSYNTDKGPEIPDPIAYKLPECAAKNVHGEGSCCVNTTKQKDVPYRPEFRKP
jgi:hypothetical protein